MEEPPVLILTQVGHSGQPRVEAHLPHLVGPSHEEVDDAVGHHAVGEALDDVMEAPPHVQAVALVFPRLDGDGLPVGGRVARGLAHGAAHLNMSSKGVREDCVLLLLLPGGQRSQASPGPEWSSPTPSPSSPAGCWT